MYLGHIYPNISLPLTQAPATTQDPTRQMPSTSAFRSFYNLSLLPRVLPSEGKVRSPGFWNPWAIFLALRSCRSCWLCGEGQPYLRVMNP